MKSSSERRPAWRFTRYFTCRHRLLSGQPRTPVSVAAGKLKTLIDKLAFEHFSADVVLAFVNGLEITLGNKYPKLLPGQLHERFEDQFERREPANVVLRGLVVCPCQVPERNRRAAPGGGPAAYNGLAVLRAGSAPSMASAERRCA